MFKHSQKQGSANDPGPTLRLQTDLRGNILLVSSTLLSITGKRKQDLLQHPLQKILAANEAGKIPFLLHQLTVSDRQQTELVVKKSTGQQIFSFDIIRKKATGRKNRFLLQWNASPVATAIQQPELSPEESLQLLALEKKVLEMNAHADVSLKAITDAFLEGLEELFSGMYCSLITLAEDQQTMEVLSAPHLPHQYCEALNGLKAGEGVGSCGTAIHRREVIITSDISTDPLWKDYRELAASLGLRSCWSLPILSAHQKILGVIATYYDHPGSPGANEMHILERAVDLLRLIIENKQAEENIRINHERYLLATKATNDAIWDWDLGNTLYWGEAFHTLFGYKPGLTRDGFEKWVNCIHPDERDRVHNGLLHYIQHHKTEVWEDEYRFRRFDGEYALVHDRGFLIFNQNGTTHRMVGSMQDITEKRALEKKLLKQELHRQKLVAQAVVNAQEKERAEIGKELHDNVSQILTTAKLYLELARNDEKERAAMIRRSEISITDAIKEVREISRSLVPASVGDLGLIDTIQDLVENVKATRKLVVIFQHEGDIENLMDEKKKLMLFRIIQEQVNNVLKHSLADSLVIGLSVAGTTVNLTITDNGKGFHPSEAKSKKGNGISNIISRAELFNGKVSIDTAPGAGCKLTIHVPISN